MKELVWIEPCGCGITETNDAGKEVVKYRHDKASRPESGFFYGTMTEQTNGYDANGGIVEALYPEL